MTDTNTKLRHLPGVNQLLEENRIASEIKRSGRELVIYAVRRVLEDHRQQALAGKDTPAHETIVAAVLRSIQAISASSLKPMINATGVILHTNIGRAPLGETVMQELSRKTRGYVNLEFDLENASRGQRNNHLREILRYLTTAEDAVVVNNNAAAVILILNTLAAGQDVIVSRGELIEIGGSFRIPDIMKAGGVRMVEVGTTNKTRLSDYEDAITENTGLIFKAHQSNYSIQGFTEEVSVGDLAQLAQSRNIPFVYDIGSGLLRKPDGLPFDEPDVRTAINHGADLVTFSCDKLMGGPQAGIAAGRKNLVDRLANAPLMRALRVGKLTLAALTTVCVAYLDEKHLFADIPAFMMLTRPPKETQRLAKLLSQACEDQHLSCTLVSSEGRCGGGSNPESCIPSTAVEIRQGDIPIQGRQTFAEKLFHALLQTDRPILGILREGKILLDMLTVFEEDIPYIADRICKAVADIQHNPQ